MKTSILRKILMALSGFFLMFFLLQHLAINMLSVVSPGMFNDVSHFMGYNPFIQYLMQPILLLGVLFHLAMGIYLEVLNNKARNIKYAKNNASASSNWVSRNMIYTGLVVLFFLVGHLYVMWLPEITYKYVNVLPEDAARYHHELVEKFQDPILLMIYVLSFIALALHLLHGFQSSFQSVGFNHNKYTPTIKKLGNLFAIAVPTLFAFIAIYHYLNPLHQ
jgi:succinate dehydrogenase / fumarate reductase, cytochrome b subunit